MQNIIQSKVFVVDDDSFTCLLFKKHLSNLGFENVSYFLSGVECLNNFSENPDIILLDYQMDHLSGFETLKKIKRFNPNAFVIMISSQPDITTAVESLKYGAFDYIVKGENETELITKSLQRIAILKEKMVTKKTSFLKKIFS